MKKMFFEENTGEYTAALYTAKAIALQKRKNPYISRVWLDEDKIVGKVLVYAYGEMQCTIKMADELIARKLQEKRL